MKFQLKILIFLISSWINAPVFPSDAALDAFFVGLPRDVVRKITLDYLDPKGVYGMTLSSKKLAQNVWDKTPIEILKELIGHFDPGKYTSNPYVFSSQRLRFDQHSNFVKTFFKKLLAENSRYFFSSLFQ